MPHFEQEIYQYVLFVGTITVIEAEFLTLEPAGGHKRPRRSVVHLQVSSNQLYLSQTFQTFFIGKKIKFQTVPLKRMSC